MQKRLTLFIALFIGFSSLAQVNLDSLWNVCNDNTQADTSRLKAMRKIAWDGYIFSQPDSAFYFAGLQYNFAESVNNKAQMASALNTQGVSFYIRGDYANAINYYTRSLKIKEELGDKKGIASSLANIGSVYLGQGDYGKAIDYFTRSLNIREEIEDKGGIAASLNNIGIIYKDQGDYKKALEYYNRSLKILEELGNKWSIATSLNNIGVIHIEQGDFKKAIEYYTKSLNMREEIEDIDGIAMSLNNIGVIYNEQGDYVKALEYYNRSLKKSEELGDENGISQSLNSIGSVYIEEGAYHKALENCSKGLNIAQETGDVQLIKDASGNLWKLYKKLGKHKQALEMHELYIEMSDSVLSIENKEAIIQQEFKYNYEKEAAADSVVAAEADKVKNAQLAVEKAQNKQHVLEASQQKQQKYFLYGILALALLFGGFIFNRFRATNKQKNLIETQHHELNETHREITDSINYAKRIQSAILPQIKVVKEYLKESFILYKPKDVVAGDFYWMEQKNGKVLFAAADCTGHGVPGAMVSVVCNNGLNRSVREHGLTIPGEILDKTREIVVQEFKKSEEDVKDGMDIALCSIEGMKLQYAGAYNPLWIIRNSEIIETKANKQPIGQFEKPEPYTTHSFDLEKGDAIYIFSDGYVDQFGGERGKKFKAKAFRELLLSIQDKAMEEQKITINETFETWKGDLEQIDDVCVIGVRV